MNIIWPGDAGFSANNTAAKAQIWLYFGQDVYISTITAPCHLTAITDTKYINRYVDIKWQIGDGIRDVNEATGFISGPWDENGQRKSEASFLPDKITKEEWLRNHPFVADFDCGTLVKKMVSNKQNAMVDYDEIKYNESLIHYFGLSETGERNVEFELNKAIKAGQTLLVDFQPKANREGNVSPLGPSSYIRFNNIVFCNSKLQTNKNLSMYKPALPNLPLEGTNNTEIFFPFWSLASDPGFGRYIDGLEVNVDTTDNVWTVDDKNDGYPYCWGYGNMMPAMPQWYLKRDGALVAYTPYIKQGGRLVALETRLK